MRVLVTARAVRAGGGASGGRWLRQSAIDSASTQSAGMSACTQRRGRDRERAVGRGVAHRMTRIAARQQPHAAPGVAPHPVRSGIGERDAVGRRAPARPDRPKLGGIAVVHALMIGTKARARAHQSSGRARRRSRRCARAPGRPRASVRARCARTSRTARPVEHRLIAVRPPAVTNSAAARSATMRSSPTASCSARCTRAKPRFQFGSHCAVTVAIAARIAPISAVASSASTSVKPAMLRTRASPALASALPPAQAHGVDLQDRSGRRLHAHHHGLRHPGVGSRGIDVVGNRTAAHRRASGGRRISPEKLPGLRIAAVGQRGDDRARGLDHAPDARRASARRGPWRRSASRSTTSDTATTASATSTSIRVKPRSRRASLRTARTEQPRPLPSTN